MMAENVNSPGRSQGCTQYASDRVELRGSLRQL